MPLESFALKLWRHQSITKYGMILCVDFKAWISLLANITNSETTSGNPQACKFETARSKLQIAENSCSDILFYSWYSESCSLRILRMISHRVLPSKVLKVSQSVWMNSSESALVCFLGGHGLTCSSDNFAYLQNDHTTERGRKQHLRLTVKSNRESWFVMNSNLRNAR